MDESEDPEPTAPRDGLEVDRLIASGESSEGSGVRLAVNEVMLGYVDQRRTNLGFLGLQTVCVSLALQPLHRLVFLKQVAPELQRQGLLGGLAKSPTIRQLGAHVLRTEGMRGLWRGALMQAAGSLLVCHEGALAGHSIVNPANGNLLLVPFSNLYAAMLKGPGLQGAGAGGKAGGYREILSAWRANGGLFSCSVRGSWSFLAMHAAQTSLMMFSAFTHLGVDPHDYPRCRAHVLYPLGSLMAVTALYPIYTLRNRLVASTGAAAEHRSTLGLLRRSFRTDGPFSLWRGCAINFAAGMLGIGLAIGLGTLANHLRPGSAINDMAAVSELVSFFNGEEEEE